MFRVITNFKPLRICVGVKINSTNTYSYALAADDGVMKIIVSPRKNVNP